MNNRILYTPKEKKFVKKQKNYKLRFVAGIFLFVLLCVLFFFTVRIQSLQISDISIRGFETLREEDLANALSSILSDSFAHGLIPNSFIFFTPVQKISIQIKELFPSIAHAHMQTKFPNTLIVTITEHQLFGVLCNDTDSKDTPNQNQRERMCAYIDTEGVAYQKAPETQGFLILKISLDTPTITIGQQVIDRTVIQHIAQFNKTLPQIIGSPIINYHIQRPASHELAIITERGFSLLVKDDADVDATLYTLKTLLEKEIGSKRRNLDYIDLRFGNKVFYKFK